MTDKERASRVRWAVACGLVIVAGAALRGAGLCEGYWLDEVVSVETGRQTLSDLLHRVGFSDLHPPLYYLVLSGWTFVSGEGEAAVRLLSLLAGLSTLLLVTRWVWRRSGPVAALAACMLVSLSTFHVHYSVEVRCYGLAGLLAVGTVMLYERVSAAESQPRRIWVHFFLLQGALVFTHYQGLLLVAALNVHYFLNASRRGERLLRWGVGQAAVLALFALWLPLLLTQFVHLPGGIRAAPGRWEGLWQALLVLGPGPVHTSELAAWGGAGLFAGAVGFAVARALVGRRCGGEAEGVVTGRIVLTRRQGTAVVCALVLLMLMPLATLLLLGVTGTLRGMVVGVLPLCYVLLVAGAALLGLAVLVNVRLLRRGLGMEALPFVVGAGAVLVAGSTGVFRGFAPRDLMVWFPLACACAAGRVRPGRLVGRLSLAVLLLGLTLPSVLRERAAFEPRPDFGAAAQEIRALPKGVGVANFVLPMWDRPALEFYLGAGSANGISGLTQVPPKRMLPEVVTLLLSGPAYEARKGYQEAMRRALAPEYGVQRVVQLKRLSLVVFAAAAGGDAR